MSRETYDVGEPGGPPDPERDPDPRLPSCPRCGGGPLLPMPGVRGAGLCKSCAQASPWPEGYPQ